MTRVIPYLLYLVLIAAHEEILRDAVAIYGAEINLSGLIVLLVAMYKSERTAMWFGFAAGIVMAAGLGPAMGWQALVLAALGVAVFQVQHHLDLTSVASRLLVVFGGVVIHNTLSLIIMEGTEGLGHSFLARAFPGAVYTMLLAWLFFLVKDKRITYQKIKALF